MGRQKFLVRLVRPVFQAAYLEVEGKDENEAAFLAYSSSREIPEEDWRGRFNGEDYHVEADCVRYGETVEGHRFSLLDFPKYHVLSSSENLPLGGGASQPWMDEENPAAIAAVFTKWIDALIDEREGYYDSAIEFFDELLASLKGTDEKVVPLMPPEERRHDIELIEAARNLGRLLKEVD